MALSLLDWLIIASFFVFSLYIGLRYTKEAGKDMSSFFLGSRNLSWWIAGTSMVATTFAADTPLAVNELVVKNGIAGNWLWWNALAGGMLTTFFFAKYWRRANIITDVELIELRYSGNEAAFLRGFKAIYLGIFMNAIIIGWVNVALMSLLKIFFNIPDEYLLFYTAIAMFIVVIYSSLSGLLGVAMTDVFQFIIAMVGCIVLAIVVVNSEQIGGITGLKEKIPAWSLDFFPNISFTENPAQFGTTLTLGIGSFLAYTTIQWWSSWYPGAEPGGGGYVAQRMMSAKDEKSAVYATLFFQIAHYCIRPWPWIVVALCTLVLYPDVEDKKLGFVMAMKDFLPTGLKGLLLVAFLAAYMSTISTQLNWGTSYLINDFYKRFFIPKATAEDDKLNKHLVFVSRIATFLMSLVALFATSQITSISGTWQFVMECGAGLGLVLILRWYWWRINAWAEITATIAPFVAYSFSKYYLEWEFPNSFFLTVGFTTIAWILVMYLTKPVEKKHLQNFYLKILPEGNWKPVRESLQLEKPQSNLSHLFVCWFSSIAMAYSILFFTGKIIFMEWMEAGIYALVFVVSLQILRTFSSKLF